MTDGSATERPTPLALFGKDWSDRPPAPIEIRPALTGDALARQRRREFADMIRARGKRGRPQIGAYTLVDLDAAFQRCRYPTNDAPLFCGAPVAGESSWCACHAAIVFR